MFNCRKCNDVLVEGTNISRKKMKRGVLRNQPNLLVCYNCQEDQPVTPKAQPKVNGTARLRLIIPGNISAAESLDTCLASADIIANTLGSKALEGSGPPTSKAFEGSVLFMDLHNTFDLFIEYAKRGEKEMAEVRELLNGFQIVIVTFVGWSTKTTELAIADAKWAIENLGVKSGVAVSERCHKGTTPESQTFVGGKGWVIGLITKSQLFPSVQWRFIDDSDDHLLSVKTMNPDCAEVVKCTDIDQLWGWLLELKKK